MIALFSLMKMDFPVYPELLLEYLNELVACELPKSREMLSSFFKFDEKQAFNDQFEQTDIFIFSLFL